jgi:hypothetical protein
MRPTSPARRVLLGLVIAAASVALSLALACLAALWAGRPAATLTVSGDALVSPGVRIVVTDRPTGPTPTMSQILEPPLRESFEKMIHDALAEARAAPPGSPVSVSSGWTFSIDDSIAGELNYEGGFGWPWPCLGSTATTGYGGDDEQDDALADAVVYRPAALGSPSPFTGTLPTRPLWRGLLGNTLVFAAAFTTLALTPALRRHVRRRRGRCAWCGYSLAGTPGGVCPECAAPITRTPPRTSSGSR